jgi:hypothetical protein
MVYIHNPKTQGSGVICAIPQTGRCPNGCEDCFFQSGRSYLEPLDKNLPNMPSEKEAEGKIVRVNDGNDSNVNRDLVKSSVSGKYKDYFYNTAINKDIAGFNAPVVLTLNPGLLTDKDWHKVSPIPKNLMFVRIRTNTWNLKTVVKPAINYYTTNDIPVVLTFMAYYDEKPLMNDDYIYRKRTMNSYYAITTAAWERIMGEFKYNKYVYSCGKVEGEKGTTGCRYCGNCIREYYNTKDRMKIK